MIFLARGEKASQPIAIAGKFSLWRIFYYCDLNFSHYLNLNGVLVICMSYKWDHKVDYVDPFLLYLVSLDPEMNKKFQIQHDL